MRKTVKRKRICEPLSLFSLLGDIFFDRVQGSILLPRVPLQSVGRDGVFWPWLGLEPLLHLLFPTQVLFGKETSGLHCPLMPSRLSPLQQTITTGTFTPFLHFVTFACNISCVIHRSNTTTILGWFPQSRFSLPLMSCMVSSGHFDLFVL